MAYNLNRAASIYALKTAASKLLSLISAKADNGHTHDRLSTEGDNRATATTPGDYPNTLRFRGLRNNSAIGSPSSDTYSYVIGWRGWSDSSGGLSREIAANNSGLYTRTGDATWGAWEKLLTGANFKDFISLSSLGAAAVNHTHNYAGSSSAGGSANSAVKLDTATAGGTTTPVYFSGGKPVACSYTLGKSVPADAKFTDTNTTYSAFKAATSSAAGGSGLVPAPAAGAQAKYLRGDGTWQTPPDTNTTYGAMTGASTSAAGKAGLVPAPAAGAATRYLRSDGTWQVPPDTNTNTWRPVQNSLTSTATDQSLSAAMGKKLQDEKAAKTTQVALSIPASGWGSDSTTACPYYRDFAVSGLTATDIVGLVVDPASAAVAHTAGLVCTESRAGVLRLRAMHIPTAAISAHYHIIH